MCLLKNYLLGRITRFDTVGSQSAIFLLKIMIILKNFHIHKIGFIGFFNNPHELSRDNIFFPRSQGRKSFSFLSFFLFFLPTVKTIRWPESKILQTSSKAEIFCLPSCYCSQSNRFLFSSLLNDLVKKIERCGVKKTILANWIASFISGANEDSQLWPHFLSIGSIL